MATECVLVGVAPWGRGQWGAGRGVASVGLAGGCGQQGVTKCDVGVASMGVAKAV